MLILTGWPPCWQTKRSDIISADLARFMLSTQVLWSFSWLLPKHFKNCCARVTFYAKKKNCMYDCRTRKQNLTFIAVQSGQSTPELHRRSHIPQSHTSQLRKLNTIGNVPIRRFGGCSRVFKLELFRTHCSAFYTGTLLSTYAAATLKKIKVCHNGILRRLKGVPRWSSARTLFVNERLDKLDG